MEFVKKKRPVRKATTLSLDAEELKKLDTLVQIDGSDRTKVMRKAISFAFEHPQDALAPRIG
jgi:hypothetical protein